VGEYSAADHPFATAPKTGTNFSVDPDRREDYLAFIERLNRLEDEKKALTDDIRDLKAEAKGVGLDVKTLTTAAKRAMLSLEEREQRDLQEEQVNLIVLWVRRG
jgi:uncharacterized protein (UPF0335 family)